MGGLVEALNARQRAQSEKKKKLTQKYVSISKLLETRSRNITCRDVRVKTWNENAKKTEILNSNHFRAMRYQWQIQVKVEKVPNPKSTSSSTTNSSMSSSSHCCDLHPQLNKLWIRIQCLSCMPSRKRLPLTLSIVKGPDFSYPLEPLQFEAEISSKQKDSKWVPLIADSMLFNDEECKARLFTSYLNENKMNLRVLMVDRRANGPDRIFGGGNDNFEESIDGDFGSDRDAEDADGNENERDGDRYSTTSSTSSRSSRSEHSSDYSDSRDSEMYSDLSDYSSEEFY